MGAIHFSLDRALIEHLARSVPIDAFVETGTFRGETAAHAARHFRRVYTVEFSIEMYQAARARFTDLANVIALFGNSPEILRQLALELRDSAVFYWLDAHWCGGLTAGATNECPLLEELDAIGALNERSVVLIDDARLFLAPPPAPHDAARWPSIAAVIDSLRALSTAHETTVVNDVIVFAPKAARQDIIDYCRQCGVDLGELARRARSVPQGQPQY